MKCRSLNLFQKIVCTLNGGWAIVRQLQAPKERGAATRIGFGARTVLRGVHPKVSDEGVAKIPRRRPRFALQASTPAEGCLFTSDS